MANKRRLIVEGRQDAFVVDHICYPHGIILIPEDKTVEPPFELKPQGGFPALRAELGVALKGSALTHIGVIIDADEDFEENGLSVRWCSIRDLLRERGYLCPDRPDPTGNILEQEDRPKVGVWIMPDNLGRGKLETFVASLIPPGNRLWEWAQAALVTVPDCDERFDEKDRDKALIHTYLAVQKKPGDPLGSGIRQNYFSAQAGPAVQLVAWIRSLFEIPGD